MHEHADGQNSFTSVAQTAGMAGFRDGVAVALERL